MLPVSQAGALAGRDNGFAGLSSAVSSAVSSTILGPGRIGEEGRDIQSKFEAAPSKTFFVESAFSWLLMTKLIDLALFSILERILFRCCFESLLAIENQLNDVTRRSSGTKRRV